MLAILGVVQIFVLLVAFESRAYAYADPGSGLLMVQIGGSMLAGVALYIRYKLRRLFRLRSKNDDDGQEQGKGS